MKLNIYLDYLDFVTYIFYLVPVSFFPSISLLYI